MNAPGLARLRRGARRVGRPLTVFVLVAGLALAVWAARQHGSAADPGIGQVVRVGAPDGTSIPGYLTASRQRLAALPASGPAVYALVSLTGYRTPAQLVPVLAGIDTFQVYARVPIPGVQTQIVRIPVLKVPDDVTAGMDAEAGQKSAEAVRDHDRVASREAAAYRAHCACVYAAVVRGTRSELTGLFGRTGVRAVDPAPGMTQLDQGVFLPPLPEQHDVVTPPSDDAPEPGTSPGTG